MNIQKSRKNSEPLAIASLLALALYGCSTSHKQPAPNDNGNLVAAQPSAQPTAQETKAQPMTLAASPEASSKRTSAKILAQLHQANLKEIDFGKIAEAKASTPKVRAYANQLIADHTNADQIVVATAKKIGAHLHDASVDRPTVKRQTPTDKKLGSATGAEFDRMFLQQTSSDHEKLIKSLQQEREDATDDDIEALIDKIIPILQQHRDLAQILMKKEQA